MYTLSNSLDFFAGDLDIVIKLSVVKSIVIQFVCQFFFANDVDILASLCRGLNNVQCCIVFMLAGRGTR